MKSKMYILAVAAAAAAGCAVLPDRPCPAKPRETVTAATAPANSGAPAAAGQPRAEATKDAGALVYVELAPANLGLYVQAVVPIIRGIVAEHGLDATWVVLCPNDVAGPVTSFHGRTLGEELPRLTDWLYTRMGTVGNLQFEYGLKRALELVGPDTELVLISANLALADMSDTDRTNIKRISASRTVDAISFADPPEEPGGRRAGPAIDFVPLVSGRVVTFTYGSIARRAPDHVGRPATQLEPRN